MPKGKDWSANTTTTLLHLINLVLVSLVEVRVEVSFLVEGLATEGARPLRRPVLQLGCMLGREYVARGVEWTLQW